MACVLFGGVSSADVLFLLPRFDGGQATPDLHHLACEGSLQRWVQAHVAGGLKGGSQRAAGQPKMRTAHEHAGAVFICAHHASRT